VGTKLDYKWKGPYRVVKKLFANVYELEDLRIKKKVCRDGSSLRAFICPEGVDPLAVAAQDEGEYVVREIVGHRLEGKNKKNKTHWYFLVKFEDETEEWFLTWRSGISKPSRNTSETIGISRDRSS
jgi:hypothetical protein